jgi:hypothetical protein
LAQIHKEIQLHIDLEIDVLQDEKRVEVSSREVPQESQSTIDMLRNKIRHFEYELAIGKDKVTSLEGEVTIKNEAREKLQVDKTEIFRKCEFDAKKLFRLNQESESITKALALAQATFHVITTSRVQLGIQVRDVDDKIRREKSSSALRIKELNTLMSLFVKKKASLGKSKKSGCELEAELKDQDIFLNERRVLCAEHARSIESMKDNVTIETARVLDRKNLELEIKTDLEVLLAEVSEKEDEVEKWLIETKKLKKVESALQNELNYLKQSLGKVRDDGRVLMSSLKLKKIVLSDFEKTMNFTKKRTNELKALCASLEREKNEIVGTTSASVFAEIQAQKQIESNNLLLTELKCFHEEKQSLLKKEKDFHLIDIVGRSALRVEIINAKACLSKKKEHVEHQDENKRNLHSVLDAVTRDILNETTRSNLVRSKNTIIAEELNTKKSEIHSLLQAAYIQEETLQIGNLSLIQKREETISLQVKCASFEKYCKMKVSIEGEINELREKIVELNGQRNDQLNQIIILSKCVECPNGYQQKNGRWRELGGEDLDDEQLNAKKRILIHRLDKNREQYLERDTIMKELHFNKEILQKEKDIMISKGRPSVKELEFYQVRIRCAIRSIMALVSELSMHHATLLTLEEEKETRKDKISSTHESMANGLPPPMNNKNLPNHITRGKG